MSNELVVQVKLEADPSSVDQTKSDFKGAFTGATDEFAKTWDKLWSSSLDSTGKTIKTSLGSSVIEGITSGVDGIGDVWSKACSSLAGSLKKSLSESLGNLFFSSLGFGSGSTGLGGSIADYFAAKEMGDTTSEALVAGGDRRKPSVLKVQPFAPWRSFPGGYIPAA